MNRDDAWRVLDQIPVVRHPCDLDLLVFFARHRNSLLTSEQLAAWLGYEPGHIAESLELLLQAGVITRTQNPTHAARMYVVASGEASSGWLPSLLEAATTREGRLALLEALARLPEADPRHAKAG